MEDAVTETFATRLCESCWHTTEHSVLTPDNPALPPMAECAACGWVTEGTRTP